MKNIYAALGNTTRFLSGLTIVNQRGAREACLMLVTSEPGYGKSETLRWYATQEGNAVYLRAKAGWRPHWFLRELLDELSIAPERTTEQMFRQALRALMTRPCPLIIDEIEHCLSDHKLMESIRDISDLALSPVVMVGMQDAENKIKRYPQIGSRLACVVQFEKADAKDLKTAATTLLEGVTLEADLLDRILKETDGRMRLVMNALATCEAVARQKKVNKLGAADVATLELAHDWQARGRRLLKTTI